LRRSQISFVFASERELQEIRQDFLMFIDLEFPSSNMSIAFLDSSLENQKGGYIKPS